MQIGRRGIPFAIEPGLEPSSGVAGPLSNSNSAFLVQGGRSLCPKWTELHKWDPKSAALQLRPRGGA